ncbi:hypothetical protein ACFLSJ_06725 [Verrucomicrobiota bacterium]
MTTRKIAAVLMLLSVALTVTGCIAVPSGIAGSSKPLAPGKYTEIGPASGSAYSFAILGIPVGEATPSLTALHRALESSGGDALVEIGMDNRVYPCGPVVIYEGRVNGTAVRTLR